MRCHWPASVAQGFSPAECGPGRPEGLRYIVNASELRVWAPGRTYYPNVTSPSDASPVKLRTSEDLYDVNIRLDVTRLLRVAGVVLDVLGRPEAQAVVRLDFTGERREVRLQTVGWAY